MESKSIEMEETLHIVVSSPIPYTPSKSIQVLNKDMMNEQKTESI